MRIRIIPLGCGLGGLSYQAGTENRLRYNGKEFHQELGLGWYDYGARMYDPAVGRWNGVDALGEEGLEWSPYNFVYGNPLRFFDPDGNKPNDIVIRGSNNSSVTIETKTFNVSVDAGSLVGDLGGNYSLSGNDVLVTAVDIIGIFDPSPASDIFGAKLSFQNGDIWGGLASVAGANAIPYAGDFAKSPKIIKGVKRIKEAIEKQKAGTLVLYKRGKSQTRKPTGWEEGIVYLVFTDQGTAKGRLEDQTGFLRKKMRKGKPIRDSLYR